MKLLIITQKVDKNDDVLGFFHDWIREFSKNTEKLTVICLQKGEYDLPGNVKVLSLGKENFKHLTYSFRLFQKINYIFVFWKHIWTERKNYDAVFVHMNPQYVIFGYPIWKLLNKKIGLWYVHKSVDMKLRLAEKFTDLIFTASKESFRLSSNKLKIIGHGIDILKFKPNLKSGDLILSVGRIAPVKNYEVLVEVIKILKSRGKNIMVEIIGAPILDSDEKYLKNLKEKIKNYGLSENFHFTGSIPNSKITEFYKKGKIFVNFSKTGSVDKAVLEAMASGLLVLTSNEAFKEILSDKYFVENDPSVIADKLLKLIESESDGSLREYVANYHSLNKLIKTILNLYKDYV